MAKVYLFRKIIAPDTTQQKVFDGAVHSVVQHVLNGGTGSILNYGTWPSHGNYRECSGDAPDELVSRSGDVVDRIVSDIFSNVYTMELNMEINISIRYAELHMEQQGNCLENQNNDTCNEQKQRLLKMLKEHFVSAPSDVYAYMKKTMKLVFDANNAANFSPHSLFSIHVKQCSLDKSQKLHGKLNMVYFGQYLAASEANTPLSDLLKIIDNLAGHSKTHMLYHNLRLTQLLKQMLGNVQNTVLLNFTSDSTAESTFESCAYPARQELDFKSQQLSAEQWQSLYKSEHNKLKRFKQKLLDLEFYSHNEDKLQLEEMIESLEQCSSPAELPSVDAERQRLALEIETLYGQLEHKNDELQRNFELCQQLDERSKAHELLFKEQSKLQTEMLEIRRVAQESIEELQELQLVIEQLYEQPAAQAAELKQKDEQLARLQAELSQSQAQMQQQRTEFMQKLTEYSDMFYKLWQQQATALKAQEYERQMQLSQMFDSMCKELHKTHEAQLNQLKLSAQQKAQELQQLQKQHLLMTSQIRRVQLKNRKQLQPK